MALLCWASVSTSGKWATMMPTPPKSQAFSEEPNEIMSVNGPLETQRQCSWMGLVLLGPEKEGMQLHFLGDSFQPHHAPTALPAGLLAHTLPLSLSVPSLSWLLLSLDLSLYLSKEYPLPCQLYCQPGSVPTIPPGKEQAS